MVSASIPNETRKAVYRRDGFVCALCGCHDYLQIHHVIPRGHGGSDFPENLITLCSKCHAQAHGMDAPDPADFQFDRSPLYEIPARIARFFGVGSRLVRTTRLCQYQLESLRWVTRWVDDRGAAALMEKDGRFYMAPAHDAMAPDVILPQDVEQACVEYVSDLYAGEWYPFK